MGFKVFIENEKSILAILLLDSSRTSFLNKGRSNKHNSSVMFGVTLISLSMGIVAVVVFSFGFVTVVVLRVSFAAVVM